MADQKISELTSVTNIESNDAFVAVDATDNTTKQVAYSDLVSDLEATMDIETTAQLNARDTANRARANHTGTQLASTISDFDTEVANNTDVAANTSARHDAVTVTDSSEIDLTLVGQDITASLIAGSIDETKLDTSVNASLDLADSAVQSGDLATVATTGSYTDLSDQPTIPTPSDLAYSALWNGNTDAATKNSIYDKIETISGGVSDGDKGDITVSGTGTIWTIDEDTIGVNELSATGTASSSTFLRGDNTWQSIGGGGDMLAANNLSDVANAATSRTNLGVAIGTDVQAFSSILASTTASYTTAEETKLSGIETAADVTDVTNVTAAGALMDSEVINLAQVKAFDTTDYATAAQGTLADSALQSYTETDTLQDVTGRGATTTVDITVPDVTYDTANGNVSALGNLGATEAIDWATGTHFTGTLDSNVTITHSNEVSGQSITIYLSYTGAQRTITWSDVDTWLDGTDGSAPAAPITTGDVLIVTLQYIGTTCYASATGNYATY